MANRKAASPTALSERSMTEREAKRLPASASPSAPISAGPAPTGEGLGMEEEGESRQARPAGPGACAAHLECDQRAARAEERRERRRLGAERVARHLEGDERAVVRERAREGSHRRRPQPRGVHLACGGPLAHALQRGGDTGGLVRRRKHLLHLDLAESIRVHRPRRVQVAVHLADGRQQLERRHRQARLQLYPAGCERVRDPDLQLQLGGRPRRSGDLPRRLARGEAEPQQAG